MAHRLAAFGLIVAAAAAGHAAEAQIGLDIPPPAASARDALPRDFIGFGYETSAAALPHYFDPANRTLIQLYRNLSPCGEVRIGGNISDRTQYVPDGVSAARPQTETTVINRDDLRRLGAFLRATGWSAMWGLNLDTASQAQAVDEALAVTRLLGPRLDSFEIGNEVDLRPRFADGFAHFAAMWSAYRSALQTAVPQIVFSGPDVATRTAWVQPFAAMAGGKLRYLTHHYYRSSAKRPEATLSYLLEPSASLTATLASLEATSRATGIPYRINETNSFSGGGKPGVSDTLGAALWCLDFLNQLAVHGCAGVNLETDLNQFAWTSHYSPIVREGDTLRAKAPYYGMLAFALTGDGRPQQLPIRGPAINVTAYFSRSSSGDRWLTVINKDALQDAAVHLAAAHAQIWRLEGPRLEATAAIRLGGQEVRSDGSWARGAGQAISSDSEGEIAIHVAHGSAALVRWH